MPLFSPLSCMKCKSFQNCSPSALEITKSFTPCHRASFGVGPQPPGRIGRGWWVRSVTQAVCLLASQQRCLQLPEAIKTSSIIFCVCASSICQQQADLQDGPAYETLSLSLNEICWEQPLWYLAHTATVGSVLPIFHIVFNESRSRNSSLITSISLGSVDVSG